MTRGSLAVEQDVAAARGGETGGGASYNAAVIRLLPCAAAFALLASAQAPVRFEPRHFERGLALLHSFEYDDARREFQAAARSDPGFAMAYWGEAMTYNEPLWFARRRDAGRAALAGFAPDPAARQRKARTQRERDWLAAVEKLFGDAPPLRADRDYADAMGALAAKYPADVEAAAFHALALLGTCHAGRDFATYMRAAAIVEEWLPKRPQHPGLLHYLIHCYDDPVHAPLGLRAARVYARIAPESPHARHMPSHIFAAMGMWDEASASNESAWSAARGKLLTGGGLHALWWLTYCYLQQGRLREARALLEQAEHIARADASPLARFHLAQMRAAWRVETGEPGVAASVSLADADPAAQAADQYSLGAAAVHRGDRQSAETALRALRTANANSATTGHGGHAHPASQDAIAIAALQLDALLTMDGGSTATALELAGRAAAAEERTPYEFGPPSPPKPARELWGELLLRAQRPADAAVRFDEALRRYPGRALSILGLARAHEQAGAQTEARAAYARLRTMWHRADAELLRALPPDQK